MASLYSYEPLTESSTRLLTVTSADKHSRLTCELSGYPMEGATVNEAISYSWAEKRLRNVSYMMDGLSLLFLIFTNYFASPSYQLHSARSEPMLYASVRLMTTK